MKIAGRFRAVKRKDRVFSGNHPKPLSIRGKTDGMLDIRVILLNKADKTDKTSNTNSTGDARYPLLLVNAPRKTGSAVERNKFRRRVRMAFLTVLRKSNETSTSNTNSFVLWVRPSPGNSKGCRVDYRNIEKQIESSLSLMGQT